MVEMENSYGLHCVKNVRVRSFSGPYLVEMCENTDQKNSEYGRFSGIACSNDFLDMTTELVIWNHDIGNILKLKISISNQYPNKAKW